VPFLSGISAMDVEASPDNSSYVFVRYPELTLWRSRADGTNAVQLTSPSLHVALPHWSPDGTRIAFAAQRQGEDWHIFLLPASGGAAEQITFGATSELDPAWSPDGKTLAYAQSHTTPGAAPASIQMLNLENHQITSLPGSEGICCPRWSPDGRYMAAASKAFTQISLYDFATQKWQVAVKGLNYLGYFTFTRDSKFLVFDTPEVEDPYFYRLRLADLSVERIVSSKNTTRFYGALGPWSGLAPDGSPLFVRDISNQEVYALDWQLP